MLVYSVSALSAVTIKSSAPEVYIVKQGDTLWDIAGMYLAQPWLWPELWRNNTYIENPHLIYPGDEIRLIYNEKGEPELVLNSGNEDKKREIRLQPQQRKDLKQGRSIPLLSWSLIQSHVEKDSVMSPDAYENLPYLVGNQEGGVRYANGDIVLGTQRELEEQIQQQAHSSRELLVVRKQEEITNLNGEVLGIKVRHVADAEVLQASLSSELLVSVKNANFEAKRGDKLMPAIEDDSYSNVQFEAATDQLGHIVGSLQQHSLLGKYDVVILDLGQGQVNQGTVMGIYMQGPDIVDGNPPAYENSNAQSLGASLWEDVIQQPALKVGELVVFKVFDKTSFGLISSSTKIVRQGAIVAKP
ncbi:LysM peptidoglycan-binding domain-containing protein [Paraneptunicella aestuarii]|nr:LysM peptidoglycan-binding domain-containing protein [Paraneptunicella aestuarii]